MDSKKAVGVFFSWNIMLNKARNLLKHERCIVEFDTYEEAKKYIFFKYEEDEEIDLGKFGVNRLIWRNQSEKSYFYVQSMDIIGYGEDEADKYYFSAKYNIKPWEFMPVSNVNEAEYNARRGFVEEYEDLRLQYYGILESGEALSLSDVMKYNRITEENFL